jgi:hypothetical protein
MTLYEMLDRTMYWQECWIFEHNACDQNMPLFKGTVDDARKETDHVWDYLMCEVDHYDCTSGILVLFVKDEHFDEPMEGHYTFGDRWGKKRSERPWVFTAEIESDLCEIDKLKEDGHED